MFYKTSKNMNFVIIFLMSLFSVSKTDSDEITNDFTPEFPVNLKTTKTFKKFMKIAEEHKMNISIIISNAENWKNGNINQVYSFNVNCPTNDVFIQKTNLSAEMGWEFLKVATNDKLPATFSTSGPKILAEECNNKQAIPRSKSLELLKTLKTSKLGLIETEDNYLAQYTFTTLSKAGKNRTRKVFYGKLNITTVKSENINETELKIIRKILSDIYLVYDNKEVPRMFVKSLKKHSKDNWQVAVNPGKDSFLAYVKLAILEMMNFKYYVYSD